jgi:hypothetical protein
VELDDVSHDPVRIFEPEKNPGMRFLDLCMLD